MKNLAFFHEYLWNQQLGQMILAQKKKKKETTWADAMVGWLTGIFVTQFTDSHDTPFDFSPFVTVTDMPRGLFYIVGRDIWNVDAEP